MWVRGERERQGKKEEDERVKKRRGKRGIKKEGERVKREKEGILKAMYVLIP